MKMTLRRIISLFTVLVVSYQTNAHSGQQHEKLFPIIENGKWGYIDVSGEIVIAPQFYSVGQFAEGLAPVRINGTYGYIDPTGKVIIPPAYDMAHSFNAGLAKVFIDAKPYFIDKEGCIIFDHNFEEITDLNDYNLATVLTKNEKYGVINNQGTVVIDTIYETIEPFSDGLVVVYRKASEVKTKNRGLQPDGESGFFEAKGRVVEPDGVSAVFDVKGKIIVPFGKYQYISPFKNGFSKVTLKPHDEDDDERQDAIIDRNGRLRFIIPEVKWGFGYDQDFFSEGLATIEISLVDKSKFKRWSSNKRSDYKGVINTRGEILFSDKDWDEVTPFYDGRAFVKNTKNQWHLIDREGSYLNSLPYDNILFDSYRNRGEAPFQNGWAIVKTTKGWRGIDTNGKFITKPRKIGYLTKNLMFNGAFVFITHDISLSSNRYFEYGFWDLKKDTVIAHQFHSIGFSDFSEGLGYAVQDGEIGYINRKGEYVWRSKDVENEKEKSYNIDFMKRGYFYAASPEMDKLSGHGGWANDENGFKKIEKSDDFEGSEVLITIRPEEDDLYADTYKSMGLYIANLCGDTAFFDAQDSRIYLNLQAKDKKGVWKDIEYLPNSWCGNSYHGLFLPPDTYWKFIIPAYEGEFKTLLRAKLRYKKQHDQEDDQVLYSHVFEGSVNPGQFWRKNGYTASNIMDPYND